MKVRVYSYKDESLKMALDKPGYSLGVQDVNFKGKAAEVELSGWVRGFVKAYRKRQKAIGLGSWPLVGPNIVGQWVSYEVPCLMAVVYWGGMWVEVEHYRVKLLNKDKGHERSS